MSMVKETNQNVLHSCTVVAERENRSFDNNNRRFGLRRARNGLKKSVLSLCKRSSLASQHENPCRNPPLYGGGYSNRVRFGYPVKRRGRKCLHGVWRLRAYSSGSAKLLYELVRTGFSRIGNGFKMKYNVFKAPFSYTSDFFQPYPLKRLQKNTH